MSTVHPSRPSWEVIWLRLAHLVAERSTCLRAQNGAALVDLRQIAIATGYNGAPRGMPHCTEVGCRPGPDGGCERTVHAEANALLHARGSALAATLYCTTSPCLRCANLVVQAGVQRVVFSTAYRDTSGLLLLHDAEVKVHHLSLDGGQPVDVGAIVSARDKEQQYVNQD